MRTHLRDTYKWCAFHKDIGNEIRDCRHLKNQIEDLLSKEYLGDLMGNNSKGPDRKPKRKMLSLPTPPVSRKNLHNEANARTIHTIHGGPEPNETSSNSRKRYARDLHGLLYVYNLDKGMSYVEITFSRKDKASSPNEDHLVITL